MKLRFLVDEQLPPALADYLRNAGHDADHINRIGLGGVRDIDVWTRVIQTGAVLITKDKDFVPLASRHPSRLAVIWIKTGNTTNRALRAMFSRALPDILSAIEDGERVIIVE